MALYNNGFPASYQGYYMPQQQSYQQSAQMPLSNQQQGIIWVQGEAGAKSYLVAPNNTVQLWDSESQVIYLKSADASGMPSMKVLDYTIRDASPVKQVVINQNDFPSRKEFDVLRQHIEVLERKLKEITEHGEPAISAE